MVIFAFQTSYSGKSVEDGLETGETNQYING